MGYHAHRKKRSNNKSLEIFMDVIAILGPLVTLPQLIDIWSEGKSAEVSIITWSGNLALSVFWLTYGIVNHQKPIIIANSLYFVTNLIIVIGLLIL